MTTQPPENGANAPTPGGGLNPDMRRAVDTDFTDDQHGSEPMDTVSVKPRGPEVWPWVWAVVTIVLVLMTIWFVF